MKSHLFFWILLFCCSSLLAQEQAVKTVDPKTLNNTQVQQVQQQISTMGLSTQAAAELARQKGATEQQVQDMISRLNGEPAKTEPGTEAATKEIDPAAQALAEAEKRDLEEQSRKTTSTDLSSNIFGSYLFNSKNLTFEPNLNIQTPKDYDISIGDQFIINIWGNSTANYQLTVDQNGQINVPNIGPVFIAGRSFESAATMIRQRLTAIYEEMGGRNPRTFAQINLGQLRSIRINLVGEAVTPGTYTLPATASVFNALYLSGGPNAIGSFRKIKVFRNNKEFKVVDIYRFLMNADQSNNIVLKNDDVIYIPVADKKVQVTGEFKRRAVFELLPNENLNDLIRFAGGFTDDTYLFRMQIYRKNQQGYRIQDVLYTDIATTPLESGDLLTSKKIQDGFENRVTILGSVYRPGEYEWTEHMLLSELILKADSITPDAFLKRGQIIRVKPDLTQEVISFNVGKVLNGDNYFIQPEDVVSIKSTFQLQPSKIISVSGEVHAPGTFPYLQNMTLGDALYLSNGLLESADSVFIQVSRRLSKEEEAVLTDSLTHVFTFTVPRDLNLDNQQASFPLEPFDNVYVRRAPGFSTHATVTIYGEVKYAGPYPLSSKQDRISDLVARAGGITTDAYIEATRFTRTGLGLVRIDLKKILNNPGNRFDLYLLEGDNLVIPRKPETVTIAGQVQNPFSTTFVPGRSLKHYVALSGGWSEAPFKNRIYVTYPDGSSNRTRHFIFRNYPQVKPGSVIRVPKKPEIQRPDKTSQWIALATASSSLTLAVVAIVNMLKK